MSHMLEDFLLSQTSPAGHIHIWERALTRRQLLGQAAGATAAGVVLGSGLFAPAPARAAGMVSSVEPKPIPIPPGFTTHHFPAGRGREITTILDFNGVVGIANVTGTGTGLIAGTPTALTFSIDNRFLIGEYVGVDNQHHRGAFGVF